MVLILLEIVMDYLYCERLRKMFPRKIIVRLVVAVVMVFLLFLLTLPLITEVNQLYIHEDNLRFRFDMLHLHIIMLYYHIIYDFPPSRVHWPIKYIVGGNEMFGHKLNKHD